MTHTIYLDILFCVNFVIDYIILLTVSKFLFIPCRQIRLITGAAVGGICSFVILLPPLPSGISMCISLLSAFLVVGASFAPMQKRMYIKTSGAFFLISFGYCGAMIAVWLLFSPSSLVIRNSSVYIAVSPVFLVITTVICYVIIRTIMRITGKREAENVLCRLKFSLCGKEIDINGKTDTGNMLKEPFSDLPVIVVSRSVIGESDGSDTENDIKNGFRLIPYSSVGGSGLLRSFRCRSIHIISGKKEVTAEAYIALCDDKMLSGGIKALVPDILIP